MNTIVLIDGENLTYGLRELITYPTDKADRSLIEGYNYRGLLEEIMSDVDIDQISWFGARLRVYDETPEIETKCRLVISNQAKLVNDLHYQQIQFVKVGYLRCRPTNDDNTEFKLVEKGVDVGLAVELISRANPDTEIVLVSSDTDLIPAIKKAKQLGAKITFISYENRPIVSISRLSDRTRIITAPIAKRYLKNQLELS